MTLEKSAGDLRGDWVEGECTRRRAQVDVKTLPFVDITLKIITPQGKRRYFVFTNSKREKLRKKHFLDLVKEIEREYAVPVEKWESDDWEGEE